MDLSTLVDRFDDELRTTAYADIDPSPNGLQIGPDRADIERVAFAVDAARETIDIAAKRDADLLVTHHGLIFGGLERVTGQTYDRLAPLYENDIALYVSHLPLDGHQELGNAAGVADVLGLIDREPFATMGEQHIGQLGTASDSYTPEELRERLATSLDTDGQPVQLLEFGPETISDVAIVTGSGVDWLEEAIAADADVLVTGEGKQHVYHEAKEAGVHVVLAGHYATETFGVQALQKLVSSWGLETTFIDAPTGI